MKMKMKTETENLKPFTLVQKECIARGKILNQQLAEKVKHALGKSSNLINPKRHHCIASTPGAGKTYTVQTTAAKYKVPLLKIQGVASISAVAVQLACAAYMNPGKQLRVWIDDCDSLFMDGKSLSVMKGILDEDRNMLSWNKTMTAQIQTYEKSDAEADKIKAAALRHFQPTGSVGIEVPTDNMHFIVTSNRFLTPPNSNLNTARKMDEAAIRDRVIYTEYNLDKNASWGWTAYVLLNNNVLDLSNGQKHLLLDWMFSNWESLPATSMRSVKELAADMLNYPNNYPDYWESKLLTTR